MVSYNPSTAQTSIGRATAIGTDLAGTAGLKAGVWSGQNALLLMEFYQM